MARSFRRVDAGAGAAGAGDAQNGKRPRGGAKKSSARSAATGAEGDERGRDARPEVATKAERRSREIEELETRAGEEAPPAGSLFRKDGKVPKMFDDVALSGMTLSGLERGKFVTMTKIQQLAIPHALVGRDVLGAARTGSGKTLAFVVPLLERLFRLGWTPGLGLGAVIISPTRELALQIYEVLRVVGYRHGYTAGIVMGGSDFRREQANVHQLAVMIATPGRLLQHLEQTPTMDASQVQMLVLDEADRLLDLGFKKQLTRILEYMPKTRQTMLFSATQTKSVKALARLSLRRPEYVSVLNMDEVQKKIPTGPDADKKQLDKAMEAVVEGGMRNDRGKAPTPANLAQAYTVCQLPDKMDLLYSFIRSHLKSKSIIFLSSCRQVQYIDAVFRKLRPGVPLMCMHGKIKQQRRMHIYYEFIQKPAAVLFATDIAARGLDFPGVDWILQGDCPEDVPTYIHRVGRTARFKNRGNSLLLLLPNEAPAMVAKLREANIPIVEKKVNPNKQQDVQRKVSGEVAKDPELRLIGQKAFKSYLRSVYLQSDKSVFDVNKLPMGAYAQSLGLANTPRIKFKGLSGDEGRKELRKLKETSHALAKLNALMEMEGDEAAAPGDDESDEDVMELLQRLRSSKATKKEKKTKYERLLALKSNEQGGGDDEEDDDDDDDDDDDGLVLRGSKGPLAGKGAESDDNESGTGEAVDEVEDDEEDHLPSRKQTRKLRIDALTGLSKGRVRPKHKVFDDEGQEVDPFAKLADEIGVSGSEATSDRDDTVRVSAGERQAYLDRIAAKLADEDVDDRERDRARVREKHRTERLKRRGALRQDEDEDGGGVVLGRYSDDEDDDDMSDGGASFGGSDNDNDDVDDVEARPTKKAKRAEEGTMEDVEQAALRLIEQQGL
ncbi:ATP-dependent RNA helicase dbp4 [Hondaea fermentalgiana]|uniref:ATP-dependent RNA helicase n=1 Tax=Hondaea fermentalgiana TaxID=2315210 RepID=A0A2R5GJM3_9STRA|nr:ATP-dependent RNA helicase dbp4 [Hondaea fermentalgiana]|eukprot:GBG28054.1 ATP-dependent RNA helicase dbp4 [Hondaea fermentalgiana]